MTKPDYYNDIEPTDPSPEAAQSIDDQLREREMESDANNPCGKEWSVE